MPDDHRSPTGADALTYDAMYLARAEVLGAPLLTFDARLATTPGHRASIELLP